MDGCDLNYGMLGLGVLFGWVLTIGFILIVERLRGR